MRICLVAMATLGILASTADVGLGQGAAAPSVVGVWKGLSAVTTGANASTNMNRLPMLIMYTKGYYSVVAQDSAVSRPARQAPPPPKDPSKLTDSEKIARYELWLPVIAQSGTYEVKGNMLTQRDIVAKAATPTSRVVEIRFEDGGKTMIETLRSVPGQPVSETVRRFTRLE